MNNNCMIEHIKVHYKGSKQYKIANGKNRTILIKSLAIVVKTQTNISIKTGLKRMSKQVSRQP